MSQGKASLDLALIFVHEALTNDKEKNMAMAMKTSSLLPKDKIAAIDARLNQVLDEFELAETERILLSPGDKINVYLYDKRDVAAKSFYGQRISGTTCNGRKVWLELGAMPKEIEQIDVVIRQLQMILLATAVEKSEYAESFIPIEDVLITRDIRAVVYQDYFLGNTVSFYIGPHRTK